MEGLDYTVEQDEDGIWCAHAEVGGGGANGYGLTRNEALADLRAAVAMVAAEDAEDAAEADDSWGDPAEDIPWEQAKAELDP